MELVYNILIIIAAVLLILIVLVQKSKGGGLAANFQSSNNMLGVRKTTDFLEKATWVLSISIIVLSIASSLTISRGTVEEGTQKSMLEDQIQNWSEEKMPALPNPNAQPTTAPAAQPATQPAAQPEKTK